MAEEKEYSLFDVDASFSERFWDYFSIKLGECESWLEEIKSFYFSGDTSKQEDELEHYSKIVEEAIIENEKPKMEDIKQLIRIEKKVNQFEKEYKELAEAEHEMAMEAQAEEMEAMRELMEEDKAI